MFPLKMMSLLFLLVWKASLSLGEITLRQNEQHILINGSEHPNITLICHIDPLVDAVTWKSSLFPEDLTTCDYQSNNCFRFDYNKYRFSADHLNKMYSMTIPHMDWSDNANYTCRQGNGDSKTVFFGIQGVLPINPTVVTEAYETKTIDVTTDCIYPLSQTAITWYYALKDGNSIKEYNQTNATYNLNSTGCNGESKQTKSRFTVAEPSSNSQLTVRFFVKMEIVFNNDSIPLLSRYTDNYYNIAVSQTETTTQSTVTATSSTIVLETDSYWTSYAQLKVSEKNTFWADHWWNFVIGGVVVVLIILVLVIVMIKCKLGCCSHDNKQTITTPDADSSTSKERKKSSKLKDQSNSSRRKVKNQEDKKLQPKLKTKIPQQQVTYQPSTHQQKPQASLSIQTQENARGTTWKQDDTDDAQEVQTKFEEMDANSTGKLDAYEANKTRLGLRRFKTDINWKLEDSQIDVFFKSMVDRDGLIDIGTFTTLLYKRYIEQNRIKMLNVFDIYKRKKEDYLSKYQALYLFETEFGLDSEQIDTLFNTFDKDLNGTMSIWEFQQFYMCMGVCAQDIIAKFKEMKAVRIGQLNTCEEVRFELRKCKTTAGRELEEREIQFSLKYMVNRDGFIDIGAFTTILYKLYMEQNRNKVLDVLDIYTRNHVDYLTKYQALDLFVTEFGLDSEQIDTLFKTFDKDHNDTIRIVDFKQFYMCMGDCAQEIKATFKKMEVDSSGTLDAYEASFGHRLFKTSTGRELEDREKYFFHKSMVDRDGHLDPWAFQTLLYKLYIAPA